MKNNETGVTLIELLIVLLISALLTAAIYTSFISQQKSYAIQTGVTDMQQNARAALTLMERDFRMAGFCVGDSGFTVQDYDGNNINQAITVDGSGSTDKITVVYAAQQVSSVVSVVGSTVTLDSGGDQFDTGANNRQYIAFETERTVYTIIAGPPGNALTLNSAPPAHLADLRPSATPPPPSGAQAYLVRVITYQVDTSTDPSTGQPRNTLERVDSTDITTPDADDLWDDIARYITNLQAVWLDANNTLLQVTLTGSYTDYEGTLRTRQHQAVLNIRNSGL